MNNNKANEMIASGEYIDRVFKCESLEGVEIHILEEKKTGLYYFPSTDGSETVNKAYTCLTAMGKFIYTANKENVNNNPIKKFLKEVLKKDGDKVVDELAKKYNIPPEIVKQIKELLGI